MARTPAHPQPTEVVRSAVRRFGAWWREPVPQRSGLHVGHGGGWGHHAETVARW